MSITVSLKIEVDATASLSELEQPTGYAMRLCNADQEQGDGREVGKTGRNVSS